MKTGAMAVRNASLLAAALLTGIVLTGCQWDSGDRGTQQPFGQAADSGGSAQEQGDSPQKSYDRQAAGSAGGQSGAGTSGVVPVTSGRNGSAQDTNAQGSALAANEGTNGKTAEKDDDGHAKWDAGHPRLAGIALGETRADIENHAGKAGASYKMDDDGDVYTVLEYNGYSVGLNKDDTAEFVEIHDSGIATGLGGLRVGDDKDRIESSLGAPKTQTDFTSTYKGANALLKIDLDPQSGRIVSLKLFPAGS